MECSLTETLFRMGQYHGGTDPDSYISDNICECITNYAMV